jgi:transcription elongation factor Elf1
MSIESELRALIDNDIAMKAKLVAFLREQEKDTEEKHEKRKRSYKPRPSASPVKTFTEIERVYHCTHCSRQFSVVVALTKSESIPIFNSSGKVQILTSKSPAKVDCYTGFCDHCKDFVENLSREELEDRYMELLKRSPFPKNYVQNLNIDPLARIDARAVCAAERKEEEV